MEHALSIPETITAPSENFRLIRSSNELIDDMSNEISQMVPGERFWVKGMVMWHGKTMDAMLQLAKKAAEKEADIRFITDSVSTYPNFKIPGALGHNQTRELHKYLQNHNDIDFEYQAPGSLKRDVLSFMNVDHSKSIIIGNTLYFGDRNYDDDVFFRREGFSMKITDPLITSTIAKELFLKTPVQTESDKFIRVNPETSIIIDSGKSGTSPIYEQAINLVEKASDHIGMVLTAMPGKRLTYAILDALERNVDVSITTQKANEHDLFPWYFIHRLNEKKLLKRNKKPNVNLLSYACHAKLLYTENQVLWGSHNLIEEGIAVGTREADILTMNKTAIKSANAYHRAFKQ